MGVMRTSHDDITLHEATAWEVTTLLQDAPWLLLQVINAAA